eukprot:281496_1
MGLCLFVDKRSSASPQSEVKTLLKLSPEHNASYTKYAADAQNSQHIIKINVKTKDMYTDRFKCDLVIYALYSKQETLGNIFTEITKQINHKYQPIKLIILEIGGFTYKKDNNKPITSYNRSDIVRKGLSVDVSVAYEHTVIDNQINCEHMKNKNVNNPLECPIYCAMKQKYEFNQSNLQHMNEYEHFKNEFEEKPKCKDGQNCETYIRQENGACILEDECHMKIYRHPPRNRNIKLAANIHSLIVNKKQEQNHSVYKANIKDSQKYEFNDKDGYLKALIEEIIQNGFKSDLCLICGQNDECKHDNYSILKTVDEKLKHKRHKVMDSHLR